MKPPARLIYFIVSMTIIISFTKNINASTVYISPDDTPAAIQAKIKSIPPGSTIQLNSGKYISTIRLTAINGTPQNQIIITGSQRTTIEGQYDINNNTFSKGSGILIEKSKYIILKHVDISGFERGITIGSSENITIANNTIHDVGNYGIMSYKSNDTTITDNTIERSYREHGIYISVSGNSPTISKNTIKDTHINGIHINGAINNPNIFNNSLLRTGTFPSKEGGAGLTLVGGVASPVVWGNDFSGIYGQGITVNAPDAVITDNTFDTFSWSGVLALPNALNLKLSGNTFADPKVIPLQLNSAVIPTLTAGGQRYASGIPVCQEQDTKRTYTFEAWRELGKDVQ